MNAEMRTKWVEALRSGKYQQGIGYLNNLGNFCCLGVLCDISGDGKWINDDCVEGTQKYDVGGDTNRACLPNAIADKYDVHQSGPLISMNDNGRPFSEIADYIEQNL